MKSIAGGTLALAALETRIQQRYHPGTPGPLVCPFCVIDVRNSLALWLFKHQPASTLRRSRIFPYPELDTIQPVEFNTRQLFR
jgi:hypothetical protein